MTAAELYQQGQLAPAIEAAIADVKAKPSDVSARYLLAQFLCFAGDFERADTHLAAIAVQDPDRLVVLNMTRHLVRAEQWRRQFFTDGRLPEFIGKPNDALQMQLEATIHVREGNTVGAIELLRRADEQRKPPKGTCDGRAFEDLRDLDDLVAPVAEVLTSNGKYYWIGWDQIERIEFHAPESPFDLLWRRTHMEVKDGPDGEVFMPAMYVDTPTAANDALRLGRATDWRGEEENLVRGIGQRTLMIGEDDRPLMEVQLVEFNLDQ